MPVDQNKKLEKKRKIMESAYQIFKSKNLYNAAVDDIVKAAGIARGTFYLYFKDKSDLIEQLIFVKSAESIKELLKNTEERLADSDDLNEICREFIDLLIDFLVDHKDTLAVITKNLSSCMRYFPEFYDDEAAAFYNRIVGKFVSLGFPEEDIHKKIYIVVDMIGSVCSDAVSFGKPFDIVSIRQPLRAAALGVMFSSDSEKR